MKILYICADPGVPIFGRKGCSTHVRENCIALSDLGHDVRVLCANVEGDDTDRPKIKTIPVEPYRSKRLGFDIRHILTDRRMYKTALRYVQDWQPDAIYERYSLYSLTGTRLAKRLGIPHLLEANAFMTLEQKDRIRILPLARRYERRIFLDSKHVVVVSDPLFEQVATIRGEDTTITRMPMAVNLELFNPRVSGAHIRERHGWQEKFIFGYVGTLTGWHGIKLLYDFADRLKVLGLQNFVLMIVGGDEKRLAAHRAKVIERGLDGVIHFLGPVPYHEVPAHIRAMNVALVPDTTPWSSPAKLFEYQGCAIPVLAPRYPAIERAMSDHVEGSIFEPTNIEDMASKAMLMAADRDALVRMGAVGRTRAETDHSWHAQGQAVIEIFEKQMRK